MSQRLCDITKWLWCLLALNAGHLWSPSRSVTVRTPPSNPSTIEAQAKFFQDFFSVQLSPYKIEFGHVCEDPNTWEQRYEKKDFKNHRDMGKVRWGDKKGGYGEHYWDLNHAGHTGNHGHDDYEGNKGSDDGSYHDGGESDNDSYDDEPSEQSPAYRTEEYDPEKSSYEDNGRKKRAYPRTKVERKPQKSDKNEEEKEDKQEVAPRPQKHRRHREHLQTAPTHKVEKYATENDSDDDEDYQPPQQKPSRQHEQYNDNEPPKRQRNQVVLVVSQKDKEADTQPSQYVTSQPEVNHYVPYESGAGVRQHQPVEATVAASAPRLFLEPSTGHVVDRATGQAYVLQPIAANSNYN